MAGAGDPTKGIQIIKTLLMGIAMLAADLGAVIPFWFVLTVQMSWDGGRTMQEKNLDVGIFYMDQGKVQMIDLIFVQKASNADVIPRLLRAAQIFYALGDIGIFVCFVASVIYMCRKYNSATGELCLAAGLLPSAGCLTLGTVLATLSATIGKDEKWESLPVPSGFMIVDAQPEIAINWGLYVAAAASLITIVACVFQWLHACGLCTHVFDVRYQMIRTPVTEEERGIDSNPKASMGVRQPQVGYSRGYDRGYNKNMVEVDF